MDAHNLNQEVKTLIHAEGDEIDLKQLLTPIWRRRWAILSLTLVVTMLTTLIVLNITRIYQATSTLLIDQRTAKPVSIEDIYSLDSSGSEYLQTQIELLKSRELAERVVTKLRLTEHPEFDPRQQPEPFIDIRGLVAMTMPGDVDPQEPTEQERFDAVVDSFMARIRVSPVMKTQLVKI